MKSMTKMKAFVNSNCTCNISGDKIISGNKNVIVTVV